MSDSGPADTAHPRRPPEVALTLLYRAYCHLCDEMLAAVRPQADRLGAVIDVIDVDRPEHAVLEREWGELVPVLFQGAPVAANELCHYRFDAAGFEASLGSAGKFAPQGKIR